MYVEKKRSRHIKYTIFVDTGDCMYEYNIIVYVCVHECNLRAYNIYYSRLYRYIILYYVYSVIIYTCTQRPRLVRILVRIYFMYILLAIRAQEPVAMLES